jgi:hypothetical protein
MQPHPLPPRFHSGPWLGYYEQFGERYPQEQSMEFADGMVRGDGEDGIARFRIEGTYRRCGDALRIGWIKTYEGGHSVLYLGASDGEWIRGQWELPGGYGDAFAFAPAAVARRELRR